MIPGLYKWAAVLVAFVGAFGIGYIKGQASERENHLSAILQAQQDHAVRVAGWRQQVDDLNIETAEGERELVEALEDAHASNTALEGELQARSQILPPPLVVVPGACPVCIRTDWDEFSRLHNFAKRTGGRGSSPSHSPGRQPGRLRRTDAADVGSTEPL